MMRTYSGSCYCERVRFRVTADISIATICNCSVCTKKGFVHLIVEQAQFDLLAGESHLTSYRFNTCIAEHKFCRHCGIHPFYIPRSDPDKIDVNLRCLEGVDLEQLELRPFDGRNWEQAICTAHWQRDTDVSSAVLDRGAVLELAVLDPSPEPPQGSNLRSNVRSR